MSLQFWILKKCKQNRPLAAVSQKIISRLTGQEEQIGGFDLICKGVPVKNESSLFSTMLGSHNNRSQQLKKLAKIIASKLSQQEKEATKRITSGKDRDGASTAATDTSVSTIKSKTKTTSKIASIPVPRTNKPPLNKPTPPAGQLNTTQSKETKDTANSSMRTTTKPKPVDTAKPKTALGLPSINSPAQAQQSNTTPATGTQQRVSISNTNNILSQPSYPPKSLTNVAEKVSGTVSYKGSKVENAASLRKSEKIPPKPTNRNQENTKLESLGLRDKRPSSGKNGKFSDDEVINKEVSSKKQPLQKVQKIPTKEEQNLSEREDDNEEAEERGEEDDGEEEEEEEEENEDEEEEDQDEEDDRRNDDDDDDDEEQIQPNRRIKKSSEDYE